MFFTANKMAPMHVSHAFWVFEFCCFGCIIIRNLREKALYWKLIIMKVFSLMKYITGSDFVLVIALLLCRI